MPRDIAVILPAQSFLEPRYWKTRCFLMDVIILMLLALDLLLAVILLDVELEDEPRRRLERVEARRQALRRRDSDPER